MVIEGLWFDGETSAQLSALMQVDDRGDIRIYMADHGVPTYQLHHCTGRDLKVSARLGNTPRYLSFLDGQKFETRDNDQIDSFVRRFQASGLQGAFIYHLETRWRYGLLACMALVLAVFWAGVYGVPIAAKAIAKWMPESVVVKVGEQTLSLMDSRLFEPTQLDSDTQQRVKEYFAAMIAEHPSQKIRLYFRHSEVLGANALALPDGSVIFTDDMVRLAEHDDELLAVMAHEVGHIVHQHGMRGVIQGSIIGFAWMLLSGDTAAVPELFLGMPAMLTQLGYSRQFEREADSYALRYLQKRQIDTRHFSRLMARLQAARCKHADAEAETLVSIADKPCNEPRWQRYLSTHPSVEERIEQFNFKP